MRPNMRQRRQRHRGILQMWKPAVTASKGPNRRRGLRGRGPAGGPEAGLEAAWLPCRQGFT